MTEEIQQKIQDLNKALDERQSYYNQEKGRLNEELNRAIEEHE